MKRLVVTLGLLAFLSLSAGAQIIVTEGDVDHARRLVEGEAPFIPELGVTHDQYAPLTDGMLLLCGLGVLYRMKKTKKRR